MGEPLLVTACLDGPLAGDPPRLDGLLEFMMSLHNNKGVPGYKVDRNFPAPPQGEIPIPLLRRRLGSWIVGACSDPILPEADADRHDHYAKRIEADNAELLHPDARLKFATGNSWTKSYRLPLRIRSVPCVRWFAMADRRPLFKALKRIEYLGKKTSYGYGRVREWTVEPAEEDYTWYASTEGGTLLMATLPAGDWLPANLVGYRRDFGAAVPPYWHSDRYTEIVKPC